MKIAWLAPLPRSLYQTGAPASDHSATWIVLLADALARRGVDLHVVTSGVPHGGDVETLDVRRIAGPWTVHVFGARARGKMLTDHRHERSVVARILDSIAPDLVHGHGTEYLYARCAVDQGRPHAITLQTVMAWLARVRRTDLFSWYLAWHEARTIQRARNIIFKSEFSRNYWASGCVGKRTWLVPNAIHPAFAAAWAEKCPPEDCIVYAGTIRRDKGVFDLVNAMALASPRPGRLIICGSGTARDERQLQELIVSRGLAGSVDCPGRLESAVLARQVCRARALVLPTYCDNTPNVVHEAILGRTPVIATDVGAIPEMVADGLNARLFRAGDVSELARLISLPPDKLLASSAEERERTVKDMVASRDPDVVAAHHLRVYAEILGVGV